MSKITIEEQIEKASRDVELWPEIVKEATTFRVSAPYYNASSLEEDSSPTCSGNKGGDDSKKLHC